MAVSQETGSTEAHVVVMDHHYPLLFQALDTPSAVIIPCEIRY